MERIKEASVAGQFYSADAGTLVRQLDEFALHVSKPEGITSRLVISPHAGYVYSGSLMSRSIAYLPDDIENVFVIAPSHHVPFIGLALSSYDAWQTPLGNIPLNTEINRLLVSELNCSYLDAAFGPEHAAEVEVPFLQHRYRSGIRLIPILVGRVVPEKIREVLRRFYSDPKTAFVISSDLSHFLNSQEARRIDSSTAMMIESGNISNFQREQACGSPGILGTVLFAQEKNGTMIRAGLCHSGDVTGDHSRVVGYGSWFFYEGSKERYLKEYHSDFILKTVRRAITAELDHSGKVTRKSFESIPAVFDENGACFVTLEIENNLRGCIGTIQAHAPLLEDLLANARNSAFGDPRFHPLTLNELETISISVSLLAAPQPLSFSSEQEMLDQVKPHEHGLIISDGRFRAVYLPSVWKQIPDKKMFLRNLKIKAGMRPDHFSPSFKVSIFTAEYIESGSAGQTHR